MQKKIRMTMNANDKTPLKQIIDDYQPNVKALAKTLFPDRRFPMMALARLLKGEGEVTVNQLLIIADFVRVPGDKLLKYFKTI